MKVRRREFLIAAGVGFRSRSHRDSVYEKTFADVRLKKSMKEKPLFHTKRMAYGGWSTLVEVRTWFRNTCGEMSMPGEHWRTWSTSVLRAEDGYSGVPRCRRSAKNVRAVMGVIIVGVALTAPACSDSPLPPSATPSIEVTDAQLYGLQKPSSGWTFYKLSPDTLARGGNSAHPDRILVRYNPRAATQLDAGGKVKMNADFPDSSLIVKEVFTDTTRTIIAYMFKLRSATNTGPAGWVWSETRADGTPFISASLKGVQCSPCHAAGIDYTRMNDVHP
jgi:hypothetical protein